MKLQGLTVCVNYSDYLEHTLPYNLKYFDDFVVVTSEEDKETQKVCERNKAKYIITKRLYENGDYFNKGKALNDGYAALENKEWVLILDCDIILPNDFRKKLETEDLDENNLYGVYRNKIRYYEDYLKWKTPGETITLNTSDPLVCGGFFQLFNVKSKRLKKDMYPENYVSAGLSDRFFYKGWPDEERIELKKVDRVIHLPHSKHTLDEVCVRNWKGRKTLPFSQQTRTSEGIEEKEDITDLFV